MSVATLKPIFGRKPPSVLIKTGGCWEGTNLPLPLHPGWAPCLCSHLKCGGQSTIHSLAINHLAFFAAIWPGLLIYIIANYNANNINGNLSISFL